MLARTTLIIGVTALYFALVAFIGYSVRRHASSSAGFTEGGKAFAPWLIAALMLSEFIGSSVSIGTAQKGFEDGISAAWNLVALSMGFLLLGVLLVGRYRRTKLNTISAILEQTYGKGVRYAASLLTIFSLNVVAVALYASGGAVLGAVMQIDRGIATVIVGIVAIFFVTVGGFRSVIYTNTLNAAIKYLGIVLALAFALTESGGYAHLRTALPSRMFDLSGVGVSQIFAWMIAGIGSIFATQYVIQGIVTTPDDKGARRACYYVSALMIPFGAIVALIGVCSAFLYPGIKSIDAFPVLIAHMPPLAASIVVIGLAGALFGGISASTIASGTLLLRDFYEPHFKAGKGDRASLRFIRSQHGCYRIDSAGPGAFRKQDPVDRISWKVSASHPRGHDPPVLLRSAIWHAKRRPDRNRAVDSHNHLVVRRGQPLRRRQFLLRSRCASRRNDSQPGA